MPWDITPPFHPGLNSIREPREETLVVNGNLCPPVPFLHPIISPHPVTNSLFYFTSVQELGATEREERKRKPTIPCQTPALPPCNQQVSKFAETTQRESCEQPGIDC